MSIPEGRVHRRAIGAAAIAAGTALLWGVIPTLGQGGPPPVTTPVARITHVGELQRRGVTRVAVEFQLPPGLTLHRPPSLRVTDARGNVLALSPMFILRQGAVSQAYRELPTGTYSAGSYQVRAEFDHRDGQGRIGRTVSAAATLLGRGRRRPGGP